MSIKTADMVVASLEADRNKVQAAGGTYRFTHFLDALLKLSRQAIDTSEERKAVSDGVMKFYDSYVSSHVPAPFRDQIRMTVQNSLNTALLLAAGV